MTGHQLAKELLKLPDVEVWININNREGGLRSFSLNLVDSHACDINLDDATGNECDYDEVNNPIYSPIIYIYDEYNKPTDSDLLISEILKYGFEYKTIEIPNNQFTKSDTYTGYMKEWDLSQGWRIYLLVEKRTNDFVLKRLRMYKDLIGIDERGTFTTIEEFLKLTNN